MARAASASCSAFTGTAPVDASADRLGVQRRDRPAERLRGRVGRALAARCARRRWRGRDRSRPSYGLEGRRARHGPPARVGRRRVPGAAAAGPPLAASPGSPAVRAPAAAIGPGPFPVEPRDQSKVGRFQARRSRREPVKALMTSSGLLATRATSTSSAAAPSAGSRATTSPGRVRDVTPSQASPTPRPARVMAEKTRSSPAGPAISATARAISVAAPASASLERADVERRQQTLVADRERDSGGDRANVGGWIAERLPQPLDDLRRTRVRDEHRRRGRRDRARQRRPDLRWKFRRWRRLRRRGPFQQERRHDADDAAGRSEREERQRGDSASGHRWGPFECGLAR